MERRASGTSEEFAEHRRELNRRLRATFLAGAEERSIKERGRGLSEPELRRVMAEYPGDTPEQQQGSPGGG